jgi:uncharacterized protein
LGEPDAGNEKSAFRLDPPPPDLFSISRRDEVLAETRSRGSASPNSGAEISKFGVQILQVRCPNSPTLLVYAGAMAIELLRRRMEAVITRSLQAFRVVIVNGPRQAGKSTLLSLVQQRSSGASITLDDRASLRLARTDPGGLVAGYERPTFIDEVQRGGDPLVLAIKAAVDRDQAPGQFVLAGSSRFLTVPTLSESLAGRARIVDLWPLSQGEIHGGDDGFLDLMFRGTDAIRMLRPTKLARREVVERIVVGGFPAVQALPERDRSDWFAAYRRTLIQRDLTDLRRLRHAADVPRLVNLVGTRTAQELNVASYAAALDMTHETTRQYLALLDVIYLFHLLPAWSSGATARVKHRPKLHVVDSGLACDIQHLSAARIADLTFEGIGPLLESFVVAELSKQRTWATERVELYHFRDNNGREVDVVAESSDGRVVAVEVKAAVDVDEHDGRGLAHLRDRLGDRFIAGVVLHLGDRPRPLGERLTAVPLAALWETNA